MSQNVSNFISTLVVHFPVKHDSPEREAEWLQAMARALRGYEGGTLARAAAHLIESRRDRRFPLPAECREACNEAIKRQRAESTAPLPLEKKFPEWSTERLRLADELIRSELGRKAAREGWILALWNFIRDNMRMPNEREAGKCREAARGFDGAYEKVLRGECGALSKSLERLGDSMAARREELRAAVLGGGQ